VLGTPGCASLLVAAARFVWKNDFMSLVLRAAAAAFFDEVLALLALLAVCSAAFATRCCSLVAMPSTVAAAALA
jgi:hypothetical protein